MNRRQLLSAMGLAGLAPYLPSLTRAATPAIPKRLLVFYTAHGNPYPGWRMHKPGGPATADWTYDLGPLAQSEFSPIWQPLHPFRNNVLLFDTLSNAVNVDQNDARGHFGGDSTLFTSADYASSDAKQAGGASFDQIIAKKVSVAGQLPSLELGSDDRCIWQAARSRLPVESDAKRAFGRLFPGGTPQITQPSGGAPQPSAPVVEVDKFRVGRADTLAFAQQRFAAMGERLSQTDKIKVEAHRDLLRDLELRIRPSVPGGSTGGGGGGVVPISGASCENKPALTSGGTGLSGQVDNWARVITAGFACDATRVASIQLGQMRTSDFGESGDVHQDIAHHDTNPNGSMGKMIKYYRKHAEHFATVLGHLRSVPEPDGTTLLDHTMVIWGYECGGWIHQTGHLPIVLAGGGGFKMGRYLNFGQGVSPLSSDGGNVGTGYKSYPPPVSRLLVSIAQKMGTDINLIGSKTTARGMSLQGPLDRLL